MSSVSSRQNFGHTTMALPTTCIKEDNTHTKHMISFHHAASFSQGSSIIPASAGYRLNEISASHTLLGYVGAETDGFRGISVIGL